MSLKISNKKMHAEYDKYKTSGDIHWQWYNNNPNYFFLVEDSLEPFKSAEPGTIVDVGSGDGVSLSRLNELGFKCFGVEPDGLAVNMALDHGVSGEYFIETAEKFAERKMKFDYLYSLNTIEHLDNPGALVEMMKHIRKFGVIVTDDDTLKPSADKSRYHETQFTPKSFENLFKEFKLEQITLRNSSWMGYKISNR